MEIKFIAGYAVITKNTEESAKLYREDLGLPLDGKDDYLSMNHFPGSKPFGVWPLHMAAESCFGTGDWLLMFLNQLQRLSMNWQARMQWHQSVFSIQQCSLQLIR